MVTRSLAIGSTVKIFRIILVEMFGLSYERLYSVHTKKGQVVGAFTHSISQPLLFQF